MKPKVISVIGTKKSGKTTTTESLIAQLTKRGYRVAAVKHVPEKENFTIDTPGKDTYRYAAHGAKTVIAVSANEIATIEKTPIETVRFDQLIEKCAGNEVVLVEGLKQEVGQRLDIPKIAVTKSRQEAEYALKAYQPIIAFSGPYNPQNLKPAVPYVNALTNPQDLAELVEKEALKPKTENSS
ncbi:MAG: molybdopterin-guanine dinucleotide biosynthesis protein B [Candidatus Bathyarchaeota archaeon]|nr:molybdopterin-guanine dinucleotide biosynthesis protein B [Candidatus Bathyarchaeota archaeon]